jgi:hypothetical protein
MTKLSLFSAALFLLAATSIAVPISGGKWFDRIVVITLENTSQSSAASQPYLGSLKSSGLYLSDYHAITHPSQPNYIAQIYGSTAYVKDDNNHDVSGQSLVELLETKRISWKSYQENYPGGCFTGAASRDKYYRRKHNPFMSMTSVQNNATLCAKNVNADELDADIAANSVPQLVYYTPNMDNDGHDTSVSTASKWLESFLKPRLAKPAFSARTLVVVTFDEDDHSGDNTVYTVLLGDVVKNKGKSDDGAFTHYSLLKTIEDNWALGNLGRNDASALPFPL